MPVLLTNQSLGEAKVNPGHFRATLLLLPALLSYFVFCPMYVVQQSTVCCREQIITNLSLKKEQSNDSHALLPG